MRRAQVFAAIRVSYRALLDCYHRSAVPSLAAISTPAKVRIYVSGKSGSYRLLPKEQCCLDEPNEIALLQAHTEHQHHTQNSRFPCISVYL